MTDQAKPTIRVLIVDDQTFVQKMLTTYLEADPRLKVVGSANRGQKAIAQIETLKPDIALVDIEMPGIDGLTTARAIIKRFPETKVLVLSSHDDFEYLNRALQIGVRGYLLKATPADELINAIHSVHKGYFQLGPGLLEQVLQTIAVQNGNSAEETSQSSHDEGRLNNLEAFARKLAEQYTVMQKMIRERPEFNGAWSLEERQNLEKQVLRSRSRIHYLEKSNRRQWAALVLLGTLGAAYALLSQLIPSY